MHHRTAVSAAAVCAAVLSLLVAIPASAGSFGCPKLSGVRGTDSEIIETYPWSNNGCPVPIRRGFFTRTGFGWDHIRYRREVNGLTNHELSTYARRLWEAALSGAGSLKDTDLFCYQAQYKTPGGQKRTMKVILSTVNYARHYGTKGIISAYWVPGHADRC